ncbi:platelet-activating factor acetylhydrolase [Holotrichia oblita]|uniref:Platelet-activating factor acetylhydrolase n=1 Tax=Holotrichia oblita TaxID=644536 RepID=A0ACB9SN13_HOLOL|nr:platelet-activating factor acetylhydrolase [Holotrichia oblita]
MLPEYVVRFIKWKGGPMYIPVLYGEKVKTDRKLKCLIFSHGLGSYRSMYSTINAELASRGYIVAAVEHRDQSACHTFYYSSEENAKNDEKTHIEYRTIKFGKGHFEERYKQVHMRAEECSKILDFLINLNKGIIPQNIMNNVPSSLENNFKLEDLVDRLDIDSITMSGHSFGGATALLTLSQRPELKQGVILDPWMFPIKNDNLNDKITQPLIFINTQTFHIATNVAIMQKFMSQDKNTEMYTILHTTHENQGDPIFWSGSWLNLFMKKIKAINGLRINNSLILKFLQEQTADDINIDDCIRLLEEESDNYTSGLTKPWT